ncbi:MAG: hypothetical protein LKE27_06025 [Atopobiaceae bacterium]|jgi:hypothetical protein|nr:hypothetical protein [Atopobiaceae bacterium]
MAEQEKNSVDFEALARDYRKHSAGFGTVVRIVGAVVDVAFDDQVPDIYNAPHRRRRDPHGQGPCGARGSSPSFRHGVVPYGRHGIDRRHAAVASKPRIRASL